MIKKAKPTRMKICENCEEWTGTYICSCGTILCGECECPNNCNGSVKPIEELRS